MNPSSSDGCTAKDARASKATSTLATRVELNWIRATTIQKNDWTGRVALLPEIESWLQAVEIPYHFDVERVRRGKRKRGQSRWFMRPILRFDDPQHVMMLRIAFPDAIRAA